MVLESRSLGFVKESRSLHRVATPFGMPRPSSRPEKEERQPKDSGAAVCACELLVSSRFQGKKRSLIPRQEHIVLVTLSLSVSASTMHSCLVLLCVARRTPFRNAHCIVDPTYCIIYCTGYSTHTHTHLSVCLSVRLYVCLRACCAGIGMYVCACMSACIYVCMDGWIDGWNDAWMDGRTDICKCVCICVSILVIIHIPQNASYM